MPHVLALAGLAALASFPQHLQIERPGATPPLELRLYRHGTVSAAELSDALAVVEAAFRSARLTLRPIDCDQDGARCLTAVSERVVVEILILPTALRNRPGLCGETARSPANGAGILVSAACARTVVAQLRRGSTDPRLMTLRPADLIGLTIAHELGHVWGLSHSKRGLMVSRFDRDAVVALRSGGAGLTPDQVALMASRIREHRMVAATR